MLGKKGDVNRFKSTCLTYEKTVIKVAGAGQTCVAGNWKKFWRARANSREVRGIHCFRHGVTSELLESGTPIHVVTRLMRHADSNVTLEHCAHIVGDAERVASEKFSQRIGQNITQLESDSELESTSSVKTA